MRLGGQKCRLKPDSLAFELYQKDVITERHRHRYEFNNQYLKQLEAAGMRFSGKSLDGRLVEIIELPDHPWFLACQFHPEFTSTPRNGHPLFSGFVSAAAQHKKIRLSMKLCHFEAGLDQPFFLIAGTCVIESEQMTLDTAGKLKEITDELKIPFIYKSSFDKANRSSLQQFSRSRPGKRLADPGKGQTTTACAGVDRCPRRYAAGGSGRRGRCAANSGVSYADKPILFKASPRWANRLISKKANFWRLGIWPMSPSKLRLPAINRLWSVSAACRLVIIIWFPICVRWR